MRLDDVVGAMTPGAIAAIEKGLTFQEMVMAFRLAAIREARRRSVNNTRAAMLLHMDVSHFNGLITGLLLKRTQFRKGGKGRGKNKDAAGPEQKAS